MASRSSPSRLPSFRIPLAVLLGAIACWLTLSATEPPGPGLDPDSMQYVAAARSLASHGSLEVPDNSWDSPDSVEALSHFPPGLSTVLAVPVGLGADPVQAARAVNGLAALALIAIVFLLVSGATGRIGGTIAAVVVGVTPGIAYVFMDVLSEPLFLVFLAGTLVLMVTRRDRPWAAGMIAAAGAMVRYAGVALVMAVVLWWLILPGVTKGRLRRALEAVAPGVLALGAWVIRTHIATQGDGIRKFSVYSQIGPTLGEGMHTIGAWAAPMATGQWEAFGALVVLAALMGLGIDAWRRWHRLGVLRGASDIIPAARIAVGAMVVAGCYVAVVLAARLFADPAIPLDDRLLAPLVFLVAITAVVTIADGWPHWGVRARVCSALLLGAWCAASGWMTAQEGIYARETGNDYADVSWSGSPLIAWVRDHAAGRPLFSNYPVALYFHAGRWSRVMPMAPRPDTARAFADTVASRHGLIVAFDRSTRFVMSPSALLQLVSSPVRLVTRTHDGAIYELER